MDVTGGNICKSMSETADNGFTCHCASKDCNNKLFATQRAVALQEGNFSSPHMKIT